MKSGTLEDSLVVPDAPRLGGTGEFMASVNPDGVRILYEILYRGPHGDQTSFNEGFKAWLNLAFPLSVPADFNEADFNKLLESIRDANPRFDLDATKNDLYIEIVKWGLKKQEFDGKTGESHMVTQDNIQNFFLYATWRKQTIRNDMGTIIPYGRLISFFPKLVAKMLRRVYESKGEDWAQAFDKNDAEIVRAFLLWELDDFEYDFDYAPERTFTIPDGPKIAARRTAVGEIVDLVKANKSPDGETKFIAEFREWFSQDYSTGKLPRADDKINIPELSKMIPTSGSNLLPLHDLEIGALFDAILEESGAGTITNSNLVKNIVQPGSLTASRPLVKSGTLDFPNVLGGRGEFEAYMEPDRIRILYEKLYRGPDNTQTSFRAGLDAWSKSYFVDDRGLPRDPPARFEKDVFVDLLKHVLSPDENESFSLDLFNKIKDFLAIIGDGATIPRVFFYAIEKYFLYATWTRREVEQDHFGTLIPSGRLISFFPKLVVKKLRAVYATRSHPAVAESVKSFFDLHVAKSVKSFFLWELRLEDEFKSLPIGNSAALAHSARSPIGQSVVTDHEGEKRKTDFGSQIDGIDKETFRDIFRKLFINPAGGEKIVGLPELDTVIVALENGPERIKNFEIDALFNEILDSEGGTGDRIKILQFFDYIAKHAWGGRPLVETSTSYREMKNRGVDHMGFSPLDEENWIVDVGGDAWKFGQVLRYPKYLRKALVDEGPLVKGEGVKKSRTIEDYLLSERGLHSERRPGGYR